MRGDPQTAAAGPSTEAGPLTAASRYVLENGLTGIHNDDVALLRAIEQEAHAAGLRDAAARVSALEGALDWIDRLAISMWSSEDADEMRREFRRVEGRARSALNIAALLAEPTEPSDKEARDGR